MSEQIELNIGKDLQFIRINGTIVGGLIGVVLYLVSHCARHAALKRSIGSSITRSGHGTGT